MLCKLCLIDSTEVLDIFEGEGERLKIADVIGLHFWFVPIKDDQKSHICCTCWLKIDEFHQFYCFIKDAQKKLSEILLTDQKSTQQTTRIYLEMRDNDVDVDNEWINDTAVNEYVNVVQDNNVNNDIEIKSEFCDSDESIHDKFEDDKDPIYTDDTNQSELDSEVRARYFGNDNLNVSSESMLLSKTKLETNVKKKNVTDSDTEEDLPLKYFVEKKLQRNNEKTEYYVKNSKEKDDVIANYMKLKCELCCEDFITFSEIGKHYRTNHNTRGYVVCCNRKFYKKYLLFDHINIHLNPECFNCSECDKKYSSEFHFKIHMLTHTLESSEMFECDQCQKKFPKEYLLKAHKIIHVPPEKRQFKCDDCGKSFPTKLTLKRHILYVHQKAHGKMCHICAKVIIGISMFKKHQLEHAGIVEPKVECKKCGAWLKHKYSLRKHMKIHIESSIIHKCEICGKISPTKGALRMHIKNVHESKRIHQCVICKKSFKKAFKLKEHMSTHTGEVLYTCPHCPKTFNASANFYTHRKKMHKKEWEELRKDRGIPAIAIKSKSDTTFENNKSSNKNVSKIDNYENNSHKLSETDILKCIIFNGN